MAAIVIVLLVVLACVIVVVIIVAVMLGRRRYMYKGKFSSLARNCLFVSALISAPRALMRAEVGGE